MPWRTTHLTRLPIKFAPNGWMDGRRQSAARPNGRQDHDQSQHEWKRMARTAVVVGLVGRLIFLCRGPDQNVAAVYDRVAARWTGRGDPERIGESDGSENARQRPSLARVFRNG